MDPQSYTACAEAERAEVIVNILAKHGLIFLELCETVKWRKQFEILFKNLKSLKEMF